MTALLLRGWGALSRAGTGAGALAGALHGSVTDGVADSAEPLPRPGPLMVPDFDARRALGRKGTGSLDRCTALMLVACGLALDDAGVVADNGDRDRTGVAVGTTAGSLKSTMDYSRETLVCDRPYLVNPLLFPNTVMNCAAGRAAIWYGLRGVNATLAGGPIAFLHVLRFAQNALDRGHVDRLVVGAVEEFSPHNAWHVRLGTENGDRLPAGEAAAAFVVRARTAAARPDCDAEILAVSCGFAANGDVRSALARHVRQVIARSGPADGIATLVTGECGDDRVETHAVEMAVDGGVETVVRVNHLLGNCQAATGAMQLAMMLALHRDDSARDGQVFLMTAHTADGAVGAAAVRGWSRAGADR